MIKSVWHSPQNRKTAQAPPPRQGLLHGGVVYGISIIIVQINDESPKICTHHL